MNSSNRLSRRRAAADRQTVSTILSQLDPADYLGRIGLESRLKELEEEGEEVEATDTMASAELYFGGEPVIGSTGIESSFAGQAINSFQDLVAKLAIEDRRSLGERGPLPAHDAKLHVTGILRGSFGFRLEELDPTANMFDTPLKEAVSKPPGFWRLSATPTKIPLRRCWVTSTRARFWRPGIFSRYWVHATQPSDWKQATLNLR